MDTDIVVCRSVKHLQRKSSAGSALDSMVGRLGVSSRGTTGDQDDPAQNAEREGLSEWSTDDKDRSPMRTQDPLAPASVKSKKRRPDKLDPTDPTYVGRTPSEMEFHDKQQQFRADWERHRQLSAGIYGESSDDEALVLPTVCARGPGPGVAQQWLQRPRAQQHGAPCACRARTARRMRALPVLHRRHSTRCAPATAC